jgi:hypothetical protein
MTRNSQVKETTMRKFRNVAAAVLITLIILPSVVKADGWDFYLKYYSELAGCDISINGSAGFSADCFGIYDCSVSYPDFCDDAWLECLDHCGWLVGGFMCEDEGSCKMDCECAFSRGGGD